MGTGRAAVTFERVPVARATEFAGEEADIGFRLWLVLKPRLIAEHVDTVYETLERPIAPVLALMERTGIRVERATPRSALRQLRAEPRAARRRDQGACRRGLQHRLAEAARRDPVRQDELGRRAAHQDRRLEHGCERAGGACRRGPRAAAESSRLAPACKAQEHLYRRIAHLYPPRDGPRAHLLRARRHHHGPALLARAEFAEHPGADERGPRHSQGLRLRQGQAADLGRLQPDRASRSRPYGRHADAAPGLRRRARHSRHDGIRDVRRADRGHGPGHQPPRQGDQFRHRLRHLRRRARRPARHPAGARPAPTSRPISSASPASATTWRRPRQRRAVRVM